MQEGGEAQEEEEKGCHFHQQQLSAHPRGTGTLTGLDPGKKEGKHEKKRIPRPHFGLDPCRKEEKCRRRRKKAATSTSCSSQLIYEEPAPSLRTGPGQERGEAQEEEEKGRQLSALPQGLEPRRKEKKCRKEWRKAATTTGCSSQRFVEELALSLRSGPEQEEEEAQEREEEGLHVYQQ